MGTKTQYDKNTRWLKPYVESATGLAPLHRLAYLKAYKVPLEKAERAAASTIKINQIMFGINLTLWSHSFKKIKGRKMKKTNHRRLDLAFILDSVAHELAHMVHWDHTPAHLELTARILVRLAKKAKELGVKDTYSNSEPEITDRSAV